MSDKRRYHNSNVNINTLTPNIDETTSNNLGINMTTFKTPNKDGQLQSGPIQFTQLRQNFQDTQKNIETQSDHRQNTPISASALENKIMQGIIKPTQISEDTQQINLSTRNIFEIFKHINIPEPIPNTCSNEASPRDIPEIDLINNGDNNNKSDLNVIGGKTYSTIKNTDTTNVPINTDKTFMQNILPIPTLPTISSNTPEIPPSPSQFPSNSSSQPSNINTSYQINSNNIKDSPKVPNFSQISNISNKTNNNQVLGASKANNENRTPSYKFSEIQKNTNNNPTIIRKPSPNKGNPKPAQFLKDDKSIYKYTLGDLLDIKIKCLTDKPFNPEIYTDPDEATWIDDREFTFNHDAAQDFHEEHDREIKKWKKDEIQEIDKNLFTNKISDENPTTSINKKKKDINLNAANSPGNKIKPFRQKHTPETTNSCTNEISGNDIVKEMFGNQQNLNSHDPLEDVAQKITLQSPPHPTGHSQNDGANNINLNEPQLHDNSVQIPPKPPLPTTTPDLEVNSNSELLSQIINTKNSTLQMQSTQSMTISRLETLESNHLIPDAPKLPNITNTSKINSQNLLNDRTAIQNTNINININDNVSIPIIGTVLDGNILNIHNDNSSNKMVKKNKSHDDQIITIKPRVLKKPSKECRDYCQLLTGKFLLPTSVLKLKARNFIVDNNGVVQYPSQKYK